MTKKIISLSIISVALLITGCATANPAFKIDDKLNTMKNSKIAPYTVRGEDYSPFMPEIGNYYRGISSWYGKDFHGLKTSNGEMYDMYKLTAAHKTFTMNTILKVTNLTNNKSIIVRVNDRGPFIEGRTIDLSYGAFGQIANPGEGVINVSIEVLGFLNHQFPSSY